MATGAAWLNGNRLTEIRKRKCALTSTGLLMEGLSRFEHRVNGSCRCPEDRIDQLDSLPSHQRPSIHLRTFFPI